MTHDFVIDLEDGRTAPMTPPEDLGTAFAAEHLDDYAQDALAERTAG